jgi:hypothetical protein
MHRWRWHGRAGTLAALSQFKEQDMKFKLMTGTLVAAGALMGLASTAQAVPAVVATTPGGYVVQYAPPAPLAERVPAARDGYVWAPGHYDWRDGRYVWVQGRWMQDRPGYEWREARWMQRSDGSWVLTEGSWIRTDRYSRYDDDDRYERRVPRRGPDGDLDRDGIRNREDRDRDGDGIANRNDDFPNDPDRS